MYSLLLCVRCVCVTKCANCYKRKAPFLFTPLQTGHRKSAYLRAHPILATAARSASAARGSPPPRGLSKNAASRAPSLAAASGPSRPTAPHKASACDKDGASTRRAAASSPNERGGAPSPSPGGIGSTTPRTRNIRTTAAADPSLSESSSLELLPPLPRRPPCTVSPTSRARAIPSPGVSPPPHTLRGRRRRRLVASGRAGGGDTTARRPAGPNTANLVGCGRAATVEGGGGATPPATSVSVKEARASVTSATTASACMCAVASASSDCVTWLIRSLLLNHRLTFIQK